MAYFDSTVDSGNQLLLLLGMLAPRDHLLVWRCCSSARFWIVALRAFRETHAVATSPAPRLTIGTGLLCSYYGLGRVPTVTNSQRYQGHRSMQGG